MVRASLVDHVDQRMIHCQIHCTNVRTKLDGPLHLDMAVWRVARLDEDEILVRQQLPDAVRFIGERRCRVHTSADSSYQCEEQVTANNGAPAVEKDFSEYEEEDVYTPLGFRIDTLLYKGPGCIVFLSGTNTVCYDFDERAHDDNGKLVDGFQNIENRASWLESVNRSHLSEEQDWSYARLIGEGIARALLDRDATAAREALASAEAYNHRGRTEAGSLHADPAQVILIRHGVWRSASAGALTPPAALAVGNRQHRAFLMTTYAAGLRLREVTHLKPIHIHSERMLIRVEQGKGQKDRHTLLSPRLSRSSGSSSITFYATLLTGWGRRD
jgi:hypothetical protein